ncbi:hypothetical protein CC2G_000223 [Coprinopsis cinerea AmutBmut pab1-1]|nr:hypothetical protein CC2G_000223 [Coprinopsis cinerea AmutBmut pab1-1]
MNRCGRRAKVNGEFYKKVSDLLQTAISWEGGDTHIRRESMEAHVAPESCERDATVGKELEDRLKTLDMAQRILKIIHGAAVQTQTQLDLAGIALAYVDSLEYAALLKGGDAETLDKARAACAESRAMLDGVVKRACSMVEEMRSFQREYLQCPDNAQ